MQFVVAITTYSRIVFYHFNNSHLQLTKTFKLSEFGVRTPKWVGVILILILHYFYVHLPV